LKVENRGRILIVAYSCNVSFATLLA